MACSLAEKGLKIVKDDFGADKVGDARPWITRTTLILLLAYNTTADLLCGRPAEATLERKSQLPRYAEICLRRAKDKQAHERFWFDLHDTAAFAMIKFGDQGSREHGRELINDMFAGKNPGGEFQYPPTEWLQARWDEYFLRASGAGQSNPLGLANIARPT